MDAALKQWIVQPRPELVTAITAAIREHVAALAWPQGVDLVQQASAAATAEIDDHVAGERRVSLDSYVLAVRGPLLALSDAIGQHWFADPVNPTLMGGF